MIALAERHEAPVWASPMSARNGFPEDHRLFAGFLPADRARIVKALAGADLIVVLGAPAFTYHVEGFGPHIPPGAALRPSRNAKRPSAAGRRQRRGSNVPSRRRSDTRRTLGPRSVAFAKKKSNLRQTRKLNGAGRTKPPKRWLKRAKVS